MEESTMPYLHLDLAQSYPSETKRELATRLCHLYADVMQTQLWRPNVGIAELGEDNLFHLGKDGLESITMVLVEIRRGRSPDVRLELGRRIVDICAEVLGVPKRTVLVEFTVHTGDEMLRDGTGPASGQLRKPRRESRIRLYRLHEPAETNRSATGRAAAVTSGEAAGKMSNAGLALKGNADSLRRGAEYVAGDHRRP
jgi:phenylpyruvate tautomerase PptA (4-oxalocrotonate tautomerase family)